MHAWTLAGLPCVAGVHEVVVCNAEGSADGEGAASDGSQGEASPGDGTAAPGADPYGNEQRFPGGACCVAAAVQ